MSDSNENSTNKKLDINEALEAANVTMADLIKPPVEAIKEADEDIVIGEINPNNEFDPPGETAPETKEENPIQEHAKKISYHLAQICNGYDMHDKLKQIPASKLVREDAVKEGTVTNQVYTHMYTPTATALARGNQVKLEKLTEAQIKNGSLKVARDYKCSNNVAGRSARLAFTAAARGLYRLMLYNTGIYIDLMPAPVSELSAVFETIDLNREKVGRVLGEYTCMCTDIFFKEAIAELLKTHVANSNLSNWDTGNNLLRAISAQDYESIVWAFCAMSVDRKLNVRIDCLKCGNVSEKVYDFGKFQLIADIKPEALEWISVMRENVTKKELKEYQELLGYNGKRITYVDQTLVLQVPSLFDLIDQNRKVLAELESRLTEEPTLSNRKTINQLTMLINLNFPIWISDIYTKRYKSEEVIHTNSVDQFAGILDIYGLEMDGPHQKFLDDMMDYIIGTKASIIGYTAVPCAECGDVQETKSGYIAWDPEQVFFETTYLALAKSGMLIESD